MDEKIYKHSFENAVSRGDADAFHESAQRSTDCIAAIDAAIEAGRHDQYFYKLSDSLDVVAREFSVERIEWVVAGAISAHDYDGRYSQQNRTWARDIDVPESVGKTFSFDTHAAVLDGFADTVRAARLHDLVQVVGAYEQCHHVAECNCLTYFKIDRGYFAPRLGVTQRELATRCTKISERQSVLEQLRAAKKAEKAAPAHQRKEAKVVPYPHSAPKTTKRKEELER